MFLTEHGRVFALGSGHGGRCGTGKESDVETPTLLGALERARATWGPVLHVSAGRAHSAATTSHGAVFAWGWGGRGRLGIGGSECALEPTHVMALRGQRVRSTACGGEFTLALTREGALWAWGATDDGVVGAGCGGGREPQFYPELLTIAALRGRRVMAVAAGTRHAGTHAAAAELLHGRLILWGATALLSAADEVFTWGAPDAGALGHGAVEGAPEPQPRLVVALADERVGALSAGDARTYMITRDGRVLACGRGCGPEGVDAARPVETRIRGIDAKDRAMTAALPELLMPVSY